MKLGILFNCQHQMLADTFRQLQPSAEIADFNVGIMPDEASRAAAHAALIDCDHVLTIWLGADYGPLATEAMQASARRLTVLPFFYFGGFHPDMIYIPTSQGLLDGFTHHYHSRLAVAGYLSGRSVRDTATLFNALVMGRAGYFEAYAQEQLLICQHFGQFGIDLNPLFARWAGRGSFMYSVNHPKAWCYPDVALELLRYAGLAGPDARVDPSLIRDPLRWGPTHPVLPPLARRLGVPPEFHFKPYHPTEDHWIPLETFLQIEFERFAPIARDELMAAPGVATLLSVLG